MKKKKWQLQPPAIKKSAWLGAQLGMSETMAQLLVRRGIETEAEAVKFLRADLKDLHDPFLLQDLDKAAARVVAAIEEGQQIAIWGDYDADGITGTALLMRALKALGVAPIFRLPNRLEEGYGLNERGLSELSRAKVELLITVDCGIAAASEVEFANSLGMDVIVTDHHEPQSQLPKAHAIVNPKLGDYPFRELAGVGVAFKLAQAVSWQLGKGGIARPQEAKLWCQEYLDLVALGTVADVVPLLDENRIMVKAGLDLLADSENPGLRALVSGAGLEDKPLASYHLGFILGPRLNAAGRLGDAGEAAELLLTADPKAASTLAGNLEKINRRRQQMCDELFTAVVEAIDREGQKDAAVIVVGGEDWHPGIVGIVASRISEQYTRPTILLTWEGEEGRGSGRSLPGFDLFQALSRCQELLTRFGGHSQAAGLTLPRENLGKLREALGEIAKLPQFQLEAPTLELEGEVLPNQLSFELLGELAQLEPHGEGNPEPLFLAPGLEVQSWSWVGEGGRHLRLGLRDYLDTTMKGIGFGMGDLAGRIEGYLERNQRIDLAYRPRLEEWQGRRSINMQFMALRLHRGPVKKAPLRPEIPVCELGPVTILDGREVTAKEEYLAALLADGARPFVYCPSPFVAAQTIGELGKICPQFQGRLLHLEGGGGLSRLAAGDWSLAFWSLPLWTEELEAKLQFLEHLVFLLPPPGLAAFAALWELGEPAFLHLLFNNGDLETAKTVVQTIPSREVVGKIYLLLAHLAKDDPLLSGRNLVARVQEGGAEAWQLALTREDVILALRILVQLKILVPQGQGFRFVAPGRKLELEAAPLYRLRKSDFGEIEVLVREWKLTEIAGFLEDAS